MGWFLPTLTVLLCIAGLVTYIIVKIKSLGSVTKLNVKINTPFIEINGRKKFTDGYKKGLVKSQQLCKNGCVRFEIQPYGYDQSEGSPVPKIKPLIVREEDIIRLARGDGEKEREEIILVDRFLTDIPKPLRGTLNADEMSKLGQKAHLESLYGKFIRAGDEALQEAMEEHSRVGITKLTLAQLKEKNNILKENIDQMSGSSNPGINDRR
jgi:hypothetical protein